MNKINTNLKKSIDHFFKFNISKKRLDRKRKKKYLLHEVTYGSSEVYEATKTMASTNVTMGKQVKQFELKYSSFLGTKYSLMNNSGSSANLLMLASLMSKLNNFKIKKGDEVIVPSLSWSTSVWPIIQLGLIPVFVDCSLDTFNIDPLKLEKSISSKTKAILLVHVYGNPCDMDQILKIGKKNNLIILEDTCEAMGAEYKKKKAGTFGIMSTFSLYFSHHITSLEGGICCTNNKKVIESLRVLRAHGWSRETENKEYYIKKYKNFDPRFIFIELGYNLRPTEVQASIAKLQLKKLKRIIFLRRRNYKFYIKYLKSIDNDKIFIQKEEKNSKASWFGFAFILNNKKYPNLDRKLVSDYLKKNKIENRPIIAGNIARHPVMKNYKHIIRKNLNNSNLIMDQGIGLGLHQGMKPNDIKYICNKIKNIVTKLSL
jgi:CDP-6-deoxy-D-xylo-4-hexulose-3-dehydrase